MILCEVGEYGAPDAGTRQPVLFQPDRRSLDRAGLESSRYKFAEGLLQQHRIGRGHAGGGELKLPLARLSHT